MLQDLEKLPRFDQHDDLKLIPRFAMSQAFFSGSNPGQNRSPPLPFVNIAIRQNRRVRVSSVN